MAKKRLAKKCYNLIRTSAAKNWIFLFNVFKEEKQFLGQLRSSGIARGLCGDVTLPPPPRNLVKKLIFWPKFSIFRFCGTYRHQSNQALWIKILIFKKFKIITYPLTPVQRCNQGEHLLYLRQGIKTLFRIQFNFVLDP